MLLELHLQNIVIFSQAALPFTAGLNVISGETGAGKSLLAGAVGLALGARANNEMIRNGCDEATVAAVFALPQNSSMLVWLKENGINLAEAETLIFTRQLRLGQPSRLTLNGVPLSANVVRSLADYLLDLAAQNEHTRLTDTNYQRELLDAYGKIDDRDYREKFAAATALQARLNAGEAQKEKIKTDLERVRYQLNKLEIFAFVAADLTLEQKIATAAHREKIHAAATTGLAAICENEDALTDRLNAIIKSCTPLAKHSAAIADAVAILQQAVSNLDDAARALQTITDDEFADVDIDELVKRSEDLKNLLRLLECKDGAAALPEIENKLRARERELANWEFDDAAAQRELKKLTAEMQTLGEALNEKRQAAAKKLAAQVNRELRALEMAAANFSVRFTRLDAATVGGFYEVTFLIAPNPGEQPSTLAETASGGEAARALLALKATLAAAQTATTLFFDEIDAGVGGRLGDILGKKLRELARTRQVIVITHLPQIAAYADTHLRVTKTALGGRTTAKIETLVGEARVEEIAQMINGAAATATTRQQAREMLDNKA